MDVLKHLPVFLVGLIVLSGVNPLQAAELPPVPAGLEDEVGFWTRIFSEVTSQQALLHDKRHLGVVYEKLEIPAVGGSATRRRVSEKARREYREILNTLASGKRSGLTTKERQVLELWPDNVTNKELKEAASRIRFQQGLADRFQQGLVRSGRWKAFIEEQLKAADVPIALAALPHVESSFNPAARSHVGAVGLWQFTGATGRRFMQIDNVVDERRDAYRSSEAAAELLKYNYSILEEWPLAITAYNHGVAGMRRAGKSIGTKDIETIIHEYKGRTFGFASRNFYVAFRAASRVEKDAEKYFGPLTLESPRHEIVLRLSDYIAPDTLSRTFNVSRDQLKAYNPALLDSIWEDVKYVPKGYQLRLPGVDSDTTPRQLMANIPAVERFRQQTPDLEHKVRSGESLSGIASRYNVSVGDLVAMNGLRSRHLIRSGQVLRLPIKGQQISKGTENYTVRRGDTISEIATRTGVSESSLMAMNNLKSKNRIYVGQKLKLRKRPVATTEPVVVAAKPEAAETTSPESTAVATAAEVILTSAATEEVVAETASPEDTSAVPEILLADPSDYVVAEDGTIEIQAAETLGHYANWLEVRTQTLRELNEYSYRQPLVLGQRLKLDLSKVDVDKFLARRMAHHKELQEAFFIRYRVTAASVHKLRPGESVWYLTRSKYKVPVWLLRQYNPDLDLQRVQPGTQVVFPRIELIEQDVRRRKALAKSV
jgi:membrane-bound lytic murein transglycosylase D